MKELVYYMCDAPTCGSVVHEQQNDPVGHVSSSSLLPQPNSAHTHTESKGHNMA